MTDSEQYEKVCSPRFDRLEHLNEEQDQRVREIHAVVTNGLRDRVYENSEKIKGLDNRLWLLLSGLGLSIALQIIFQVI